MWSGLQRVRPRGSKYPCCQSCCRFRSRSRVGYVRRFVPWTVKSNVLSSMTGVRRLMRFLCIWILTLDVFNFAIVFSRHFSTTGTGTARGGEELATCLFAISLLTWSDTNFIYILVPKWLARDGCGHAHVSCTCLYFYFIVRVDMFVFWSHWIFSLQWENVGSVGVILTSLSLYFFL
jgi:hypothetical protein